MSSQVSNKRTLSTAVERKEALLTAAMSEFAARGFYGTPTTEIARAAGISQAYLFRLFPTKVELFEAVVQRCFERTLDAFSVAAGAAPAPEKLSAMGAAYRALVEDREILLCQLQAYAAATEPSIRDAIRRGFKALFDFVSSESGEDDETVKTFFAYGMLINVMSAIDVAGVDERWAKVLVPGDAAAS